MNKADQYFKQNLREVLEHGTWDENPRPKWGDGTPARSKFITQVTEKYDIAAGEFPIPTLRNTAVKTGIKEIFWIYQDQSNSLADAHARGITWWDEWDIGDGTIGNRYGATVKQYDLMNKLSNGLKNDPFSRRHIIDLYQEECLRETKGLNPCAYSTLWSVRNVGEEMFLDVTLVQRSQDYLMASSINKIQFSAMQMMVAGHLGYRPGNFVHFVQNLHIYDRHIEAAEQLLVTESLNTQPILKLNVQKNFYDYTIDDFEVTGTEGIPKLKEKLEIAV